MEWWLVWAGFAAGCVLLGWVGYHFTVRTLRFVTAALVLSVAVLVTRYGVMHRAGKSIEFVHAFTKGMDKLCTVFFQPVFGGHVFGHGRVGWLVIVAVLIFAYRQLEVWAMSWQPPAVDTSALDGGQPVRPAGRAPGGHGGPDMQHEHDKLVAELRFRLPAVEVRSPSVLPGSATAGGLASVAENSGAAGSGLAGAVIRLAGMLWPNPRRYRVRVWVEPSDLPGATRCWTEIDQELSWQSGRYPADDMERAAAARKVTVDLADPQTGGSIATRTLLARDLGEAAEVAAGYVARQIFKADPTAPAWCTGSFDGGDLAALLCAQQLRVPIHSLADAGCTRQHQIKILSRAVRSAASAGVARHELALLLDLEGCHVEALKLHAINREQYPRFYRSRYRLGMSLEMIANPAFTSPEKDAECLFQDGLGSLDRCAVTHNAAGRVVISGGGPDKAPGGGPSKAGRAELLTAARDELRACRRQLMLWSIFWASFRHRDERAIRKPHWRLQERQRFSDGARVAELLVIVRQTLASGHCPRRDRLRVRRAIWVTAAITGDRATIREFLKDPAAGEPGGGYPGAMQPPGRKSQRTRWLPWQRRTPSWQAAYNTACLYSALAARYPRDEMACRAVASLDRAVRDRDCDMERPSDWISMDPDLSGVRLSPAFGSFLGRQIQNDYPRQDLGQLSPDADPAGSHAGSARS
jgi:hypothetical protein